MKKLLLALSVSLISLNSFAIEFKMPSDKSDRKITIGKSSAENGEIKLFDLNSNLRLTYTYYDKLNMNGYKFSYYNQSGTLVNSTVLSVEKTELLELMMKSIKNYSACTLEFTIDGSTIDLNRNLVIKTISSSCDVLAQADNEDNQA
jgi:hypothetical protein